MVLNIRLKAIDHSKNKENTTIKDPYMINQLFVFLKPNINNRRPLSALEFIWETMSDIGEGESELVLKVSRASTTHDKATSCTYVYLREFAETENQAYRFTAVVTTLRLITQNLMRNSTTTLRDIFYRDVSAFQGSQARLNETLSLIASSLGFSIERDLKINPSPKGLVFGGPQIRLVLDEGTTIDLNYSKSVLVPTSISESYSFRGENIDAIVVMEKEAVFKTFNEHLLESYIHQRLIVLTGKGNPDKASTRFLSALRVSFPKVPVFLFVDSDVYGLRILWTYMLAAGGPAPNIIFAGTFLLEHSRGYLTIAPREWKLMMNFLKEIVAFEKKCCIGPEKNLALIKRELKRGMLLGKKAELNVMCESSPSEDLNTYLWEKVAHEICNKT